jgi:hypothetical protein
VPEELLQQPSLGKPGEPCEECGAALAADQRYCLNCGRRRGGPRIDYGAVMAATTSEQASQQPQPAASANGAPPPEEPAKRERDYAPLAAVGGIAILGLMLLIGVLIGKGDSPSSAPATPSVLRVDPGESGGESSGGNSNGSSANTASKGLNTGKKKKKANSGGDTGEIEASTDQLEELNSETGEDAAKKALELPNEIATPGEPPPIDKSKPPGGGEKGITIE